MAEAVNYTINRWTEPTVFAADGSRVSPLCRVSSIRGFSRSNANTIIEKDLEPEGTKTASQQFLIAFPALFHVLRGLCALRANFLIGSTQMRE